MTNQEIASQFLELADILDLAGELPFKPNSYRKVASSLQKLQEPWTDIVAKGKFDKIPGAGKAIRVKLIAIANIGSLPALEKWRRREIYAFYPWLKLLGIEPRPLGMLIRKLDAKNTKDLLMKLRDFDLKVLTGKTKQTAKYILDRNE
jgi:DNA polymerase (family 10)